MEIRMRISPGSYEEGRGRYDDIFWAGVNVTRHFPSERPSLSVSTGRRRQSDQARKKEDCDHVNITWKHFLEDFESFALRENGGAKKHGTTAGLCDERINPTGRRAQLLPGLGLLHGHLRSKKINDLTKRSNDNAHLDINQVLLDLTPTAKRTTVSTNTVWRVNSSVVKHKEYLDRPCTFAEGIATVTKVHHLHLSDRSHMSSGGGAPQGQEAVPVIEA